MKLETNIYKLKNYSCKRPQIVSNVIQCIYMEMYLKLQLLLPVEWLFVMFTVNETVFELLWDSFVIRTLMECCLRSLYHIQTINLIIKFTYIQTRFGPQRTSTVTSYHYDVYIIFEITAVTPTITAHTFVAMSEPHPFQPVNIIYAIRIM
jgi:hypothetical protein